MVIIIKEHIYFYITVKCYVYGLVRIDIKIIGFHFSAHINGNVGYYWYNE